MKRFRLVSRAAMIRLLVLSVVLGLFVTWCWWAMIRMPLKSYAGPWFPLTPQETEAKKLLQAHVTRLAGEIGERSIFRQNSLQLAADYIKYFLAEAGYQVRTEPYVVTHVTCENIYVEIQGSDRPDEIVLVGAHYDSVSGAPGANDNGSGIAALLVLAQRLAGQSQSRTLRLVAFANEEPPHFQTEQMGSLVHAKGCRQRRENIVAMLSLETMGCFSETPESQKYPFPFGLAYPSTGNFIAFVGNRGSAPLVRDCVRTFRQQIQFPSEGGALPGWIAGVGWSDHWSFWQAGYPGVMVTDTAPFRYAQYHTEQDTPDQLDYDRLARITIGLETVVTALLNRRP